MAMGRPGRLLFLSLVLILGRLLVLTFAVPHLSTISARAHRDVQVPRARDDVQLQAGQVYSKLRVKYNLGLLLLHELNN